jgi:3'-5' exoribonuclease
MGRRFVDQLSDGENIEEVYLLTDKQLKANRNGNLFIQTELRDRTGVIMGRMWNVGEMLFRSFENGDFLAICGKVQLFQGSLQIILSSLEKVDPNTIELPDYLPHTDQDVGKLLDRLRTSLRKVSNHHLKALSECYMIDDKFLSGFCKAPAGIRVHHAYIGGLLEHVVMMLDVAERIAPLYPEVDKDLLLMGIFLHDTGKVRELSYSRAFGYSNEGQLIGHLSIGVEMLEEMARKVPELTGEPFPRELLMRLKHMILSHHGSLEFGSPKVPMTPEAVALHAIDHLDTRIHITLREIKDDRNNPSAWTPFNNAMQRKLYKGTTGTDGNDLPSSMDDNY